MNNQEDTEEKKEKESTFDSTFFSASDDGLGARIKEAVGDEPVKAFARRCGVPESSIRAYISNKKKPGIDPLTAISEASGLTVDWLAKGRGIKYIRDLKHAQERLNGAPPRAYGEFPEALKPYEKRLDALLHYLAMIEDELEVEQILSEVTLRAETVIKITELQHTVNELRAEYLKKNTNNK